ncbi:aspartate/glutamate racemase family protein, partial [Mycobacterium tuberculosis]|nr:aspartate/glutamate racemase family protein [Mycobacterium tuberculosis]
KAHIVALVGRLIASHAPDLAVIACNTASTLVLPELRARHALPFVGTVPAIKTAAERTSSRLVSVLATPGTVKRDYTRALIDQFAADVAVTLVGSRQLARLAEMAIGGWPVADAAVAAEIGPCFVTEGSRCTDTVVLACTHYP